MATVEIEFNLLAGIHDELVGPDVEYEGPRPLLRFDNVTDELLTYSFKARKNYTSGGTIVAECSAGVTTGNVAIRTEVMTVAVGERIDSAASFGAKEKSADTAVDGTTAGNRFDVSDALTVPSFVVGDRVYVRFGRDNLAASNATGDLRVWGLTFEYES